MWANELLDNSNWYPSILPSSNQYHHYVETSHPFFTLSFRLNKSTNINNGWFKSGSFRETHYIVSETLCFLFICVCFMVFLVVLRVLWLWAPLLWERFLWLDLLSLCISCLGAYLRHLVFFLETYFIDSNILLEFPVLHITASHSMLVLSLWLSHYWFVCVSSPQKDGNTSMRTGACCIFYLVLYNIVYAQSWVW